MDSVVHFEFPYVDRERIARFYQTVFGWKTEMMGPEMGNYILATTAEKDVKADAPRGAINGGFFPRDDKMPAQVPSVVIGVGDIAKSMAAVKKAGGEVLGEPMEIPGVGRYVAFYDTERNRVSMLQPNMQGGA
ncbi:MAG: Glyoxalase/bleomycin resistance protein/dioxygenase [Ramlibacter sp.]|nr:Glyoxalase/bleomycin resistance protein/dioxygenase [Ramlibacter sp.]